MSPASHVTLSADAGEASGDSTFLAGSGLDQSKHGDSAQGPGRGAEGSNDGGGVGNRVLMDTNKASLRLARQHCSYLLCSFRTATLHYDRSHILQNARGHCIDLVANLLNTMALHQDFCYLSTVAAMHRCSACWWGEP